MRKRHLVIALVVVVTLGAAFLGYTLVRSEEPDGDGALTAADSAAEDAQRPPADRRALAVARRLIARTDSAFAAVEPLSAAEKRRLRRYLQPQHIVQARQLGLDPVRTRTAAVQLGRTEEGGAVPIHTNDFYIVDPSMSYAVALVVPSTKHLLERLGRRFQAALLERGLPPYRFVLTNVLRTGQDQAALRGTNVNAAQGQSTHEYGTTFDVYYEWFHYAAVHDTLALSRAGTARTRPQHAALNEELLREQLYEAYVRFGEEHAAKLKAVLGRAILDMQEEGLLMATYERRQPVFHLTVAQEVTPPTQAFPQTVSSDSLDTTTAVRSPAAE